MEKGKLFKKASFRRFSKIAIIASALIAVGCKSEAESIVRDCKIGKSNTSIETFLNNWAENQIWEQTVNETSGKTTVSIKATFNFAGMETNPWFQTDIIPSVVNETCKIKITIPETIKLNEDLKIDRDRKKAIFTNSDYSHLGLSSDWNIDAIVNYVHSLYLGDINPYSFLIPLKGYSYSKDDLEQIKKLNNTVLGAQETIFQGEKEFTKKNGRWKESRFSDIGYDYEKIQSNVFDIYPDRNYSMSINYDVIKDLGSCVSGSKIGLKRLIDRPRQKSFVKDEHFKVTIPYNCDIKFIRKYLGKD